MAWATKSHPHSTKAAKAQLAPSRARGSPVCSSICQSFPSRRGAASSTKPKPQVFDDRHIIRPFLSSRVFLPLQYGVF